MTPERWRQVTGLFHGARGRDPAGRDAFLSDACRGDPTLRPEVEAMLAGLDHAGRFGDDPLVASGSQPEPGPSPLVVQLAAGSELDRYRILGHLAGGGMGQVYRAFDPRLHREVAIKVCAARFSERFAREVRAISTLNHPNICTVHDVGPNYLVTELVQGETLREWLTRAPPLERRLSMARQVLEALGAAHRAGIVHRDLKPDNVMVRVDGYAKVVDFGLAAQCRPPAGPLGESLARTGALTVEQVAARVESQRVSRPGEMLGTIPYMSPEQIGGQPTDHRADLFAFGIILYEMLTGQHPWPRPSSVDTLHAILHDAPPPVPATSPVRAELAAVVQKLLQKSPAARYQSADAVLDAFQHLGDGTLAREDGREDPGSGAGVAPTRPRARHGRLVATLGGLVIVTAIAAVWVVPRSDRAADTPAPRVVPLTTLSGNEMGTTFSPDGDQVAFRWDGEKQDNCDIYVKIIGASEVRRLTTAPGADSWPAWSPDGRQIAYVRQDEAEPAHVRLMTSLGGSDRKLSDVPVWGGAQISWSPDNRYVAAGVAGSEQAVFGDTRESNGLYLIPVAGGEPRPLTTPKAPRADHAPSFSPDGRRLAYVSCKGTFSRTNCEVHILDLDPSFSPAAPPRRLTQEASFDIRGLAWSRDGTSIVYTVSDTLNYLWRVRADGNTPAERIEMAGLNSAWPATATSRDRLAFTRILSDVDIYQFQSGSSSRPLLSSSFLESDPQVSPDGRRVAFCSNRSGESMEVWVAAADGTGAEQLTHGPGTWQCSPHWSPDGQQIAFDSDTEDGRRHIWAIDADGGTPRQITRDEGEQIIPSWSRDGQWIYYSWAQAAGRDIWRIQPAGGAKQRITSDGEGLVGLESADGESLLYMSLPKRRLLAVPLTGGPPREVVACVDGTAFAVGPERVYYVACGSGDAAVHIRNPVTGEDQVLGTLEKYDRGWRPSSFGVSPDGSAVLYRRATSSRMDLMLIENFR
jgi:eukaryotic-like serine/threonine-protein kinase